MKDEYLLLYLGCIVLFPLFLLSFFNNPGSDDFDYEFKRPFIEIIKTQTEVYYGWSGRFFSIPFMSINPDIFIEFSIYKFYPIIIISLFIFSLFWFFKLIFSQENNLTIASFASFFIFLFSFQVPDMCQAFFWYSSSICYQFGIVLFLVFASSFMEYKKSKRRAFLFLAIVTVIASIGCNEILMLIILSLSIWYIIIKFYYIRKIDFHEKILLLIVITFSIIVIVAPGNNARLIREGNVENSHNLLLSMTKTIFYLGKYFIKWLPIILLASYLFRNRIVEILNKLKYNRVFIHPMLCFTLIIVILFPCFFTGFWIKNYLLPDRALNSIYFFFLFFVLYFIGCILAFVEDKFELKQRISKRECFVLVTILLMLTFSGTPISEAYFDLFSGKAYKYNKELEQRRQIIDSSNQKYVEVPMLINYPKTIYNSEVMGITNDKNNWKNIEVSKYYKKTIIIIPTSSVISE